MKLNDIKAQIDSFFDNISEEALHVLLVEKYGMPISYTAELPPNDALNLKFNISTVEVAAIEYHTVSPLHMDAAMVELTPVDIHTKMSTDITVLSKTLSFAA